jgi:hypothetical protein
MVAPGLGGEQTSDRRTLTGYRGEVPTWLLILTALLLAYVIWRIGMATLRSFALSPSGEPREPVPEEPEDVDDLDVYLVCGECGTELKISRLGELQVPRHCGEKMQVVRRTSEA